MRLLGLMLASTVVLGAQTVEGTLVNAATKAAVAGADVHLHGPDESSYAATTDAQGHFHFDDVPDGSYALDCKKEGFGPSMSRPVAVKAGGDAVKLHLTLVPLGSISGRVVDGKGRPVPDARLILTVTGTRGEPVRADEAGRFSIANLGSTRYILMARAPLGWDPPDPVEGRKFAWLPTYYPNAGFAAGAAKIAVGLGTDVKDLEIKLLSGPVYHVRGVVVGPDGHPVPEAEVYLGEASRRTGNGTFDFESVDGEWQLQARAPDGDTDLRGYQTVYVAGHDLDGVKLWLEPPFSIHGRLLFDPPLSAGKYPYRKTVTLTASEGLQSRRVTEPDEAGNFTINSVYPGAYTVSPPPLFFSGYYLESMRLGSQDVLGADVELRSGFLPLDIRLKAGGGMVRGHVEGCTEETIVVLVPMEPALRRAQLLGYGWCDAPGHYEISNLRPGDYYALAVLMAWLDDDLIAQGRRVTVHQGETSGMDLKVVKAAGQ